MIQRIRISNYKSLRSADVTLKPLSVLVGPNASGKSNFLDAIQLLSRIAKSRSLKEAFEPPYRGKPLESFSLGPEGIEGMMKQRAAFEIEVDIKISPAIVNAVNKEISETKPRQSSDLEPLSSPKPANYIHHTLLRYRIKIEIAPDTGALHIADEFLAALDRDGNVKPRPRPFLERMESRIHLRMEGQAHPTYFDKYLDHAILSRPHYAPHYPHLTALKSELESWCFYYFEPRERMRSATSVKEVRHIGLMGEELAAFLHTLKNIDPRQFMAVEKAVHSLIPSITGIRTEVNRYGEVELSLMEGAVAMPARVVSEGTLRVLGLLALSGVKEPPALVGFEEPENGIHPRRIREIAKILANRADSDDTQLIVTTHSPILPDHVPKDSLFVCKKKDGSTVIEPFQLWGPLAASQAIDEALEEDTEITPVSQRLLRGDFDA
ncbi:MAG: AAA family ATPase [Acidobacteria bacterium]|nr:AAA family ATPase [Acidobacteriota bacterium]